MLEHFQNLNHLEEEIEPDSMAFADEKDNMMGKVLFDFDKEEKPRRPTRLQVPARASFTQRMSSSFTSPAPKRHRKSFGSNTFTSVASSSVHEATGEHAYVDNRDRADSMASILSDSECKTRIIDINQDNVE